jgi:hypothetical protein
LAQCNGSALVSTDLDPNPAFYLNADPDSREPNQCGSMLKIKVGNRPHTVPMKLPKAFFKGRKPGFFLNFGQLPCFWIRILIPNTDPDLGQPNECGSMRIQIRLVVLIFESKLVNYDEYALRRGGRGTF